MALPGGMIRQISIWLKPLFSTVVDAIFVAEINMRYYSALKLLLAIIVTFECPGQEAAPGSGFGVECSVLAGRIVRHEKKFTAPIPPVSAAFDANFLWRTYGKKDWQQRRNFPQVGIGMTYTSYGNNAVFGNCLGIYPNMQLTLLKRKGVDWTFRFGDGIAYVTKKYQKAFPVDTINTAIGSHINDFAIFMTDIRLPLDYHWQIQFGANFTHISNTDYHQPNLGVNMAGIHVGLQYFPVCRDPQRILKELPRLPNRWLFTVRTGFAYNEARAKDSAELPTYIVTAYASRRWQGKNKLFFGADYAYHNDVYAFLKYYGVDYGHEMGHAWDGAFFAGNEMLFGRVGLSGQVGVYYHQTFLKFDPVYEKIGCNFYIIQAENGWIRELFVSTMLLTHEIVAQYGELGLGASF